MRGARIEIQEDGHELDPGMPIKPNRVLVNGTDVGYVNEVNIETDRNDVVYVNLRLAPSSVSIRATRKPRDWRPAAYYSAAILVALFLGRR